MVDIVSGISPTFVAHIEITCLRDNPDTCAKIELNHVDPIFLSHRGVRYNSPICATIRNITNTSSGAGSAVAFEPARPDDTTPPREHERKSYKLQITTGGACTRTCYGGASRVDDLPLYVCMYYRCTRENETRPRARRKERCYFSQRAQNYARSRSQDEPLW